VNQPSNAFERLHPGLQRWVYRQRWKALRPIQEAAAEPILALQSDVILAAATAGGKTEAAFLPLLTSLATEPVTGSLGALCISPLKALINDQFGRLEEMGAAVDLPVHRWHGDVPAGAKKSLLKQPSGLLLITPESLEALFVRRGPGMQAFFADLRFVVVDELHAFIGSERGRQLQSLLHRLEMVVRRRVPRIALSATLGNLSLAAEFLRPGGGERVVCIEDRNEGQEVKLQVRGYRQRAATSSSETEGPPGQGSEGGSHVDVARDLFRWLRGGHHLVFANRRSEVEHYSDLLRRLCEQLRVPNEFWPHHGSLSKELREDAEKAINERSRPTTLIATTTLELGIDVGAIGSVVQIGTPPSVAALRQRLGRSGRLGDPAVLRIVIRAAEVTPQTHLADTLHPELVQAIAMVELLIAGWVEPPPPAALHLSTLVQQTLSLVAQVGGADAKALWRVLCDSGPFSTVDEQLFGDFLRSLGAADLIIQDHRGEIILGLGGERVVDHYSFYAAFNSPEEYRLVTGGKTLGQLPIGQPLFSGLLLIFGGRRWRVLDVDEEHKIVNLAPARGGRTPTFTGGGGPVIHDRVRETMFDLYTSDQLPRYLDPTARDLLGEARSWFARFDLARRSLVADGDATFLFPWIGDRGLGTLALLLGRRGLAVSTSGDNLRIEGLKPREVVSVLREQLAAPAVGSLELARHAANNKSEKFHLYLDDELLIADYASSRLDLARATSAIRRILEREAG